MEDGADGRDFLSCKGDKESARQFLDLGTCFPINRILCFKNQLSNKKHELFVFTRLIACDKYQGLIIRKKKIVYTDSTFRLPIKTN